MNRKSINLQRDSGKRETENGNLRVSESRSKVHFDYAEREQIQDDKSASTNASSCPKSPKALHADKGQALVLGQNKSQ